MLQSSLATKVWLVPHMKLEPLGYDVDVRPQKDNYVIIVNDNNTGTILLLCRWAKTRYKFRLEDGV